MKMLKLFSLKVYSYTLKAVFVLNLQIQFPRLAENLNTCEISFCSTTLCAVCKCNDPMVLLDVWNQKWGSL